MPSATAVFSASDRLRLLLAADEVGVGGALGLLELALGAGQLLGQLGDLRLQVRLVRLLGGQDLGLQLLGLSSPLPCAR